VNEDSPIVPKHVAYGLLTALLVYAGVRSVFAAAGKPLWYDEILTLTVTSLDTWSARLHALQLPLDGQPPLFYWIEHLALPLSRHPETALRLPSIAAFLVAIICVFVYVRKRAGETVAFLCAFVLLLTDVFLLYALEARPYSMVFACVAFALVCYQRLPSPSWTVLLAISLALAQSLHYLAVLTMIPFGLAELVLVLQTRRIRWQVWAALASGAIPLFFEWRLLKINQTYYGAHFWAKFHLIFLPSTYGEYLETTSRVAAGIVVVILFAIVRKVLSAWRNPNLSSDAKTAELVEATLLVGLIALPFIAYMITSVAHAGLTARYVLCTVLGLTLSIGFLLGRASRKTVALFATFVFMVSGLNELHFWRLLKQDVDELRTRSAVFSTFIQSAGYGDLPVVVLDASHYLEFVHYAPADLDGRLVLLIRQPTPADVNFTDTIYKAMQLLPPYVPVRTYLWSDFLAKRDIFLVYEEWKNAPENFPTRDLVVPERSLRVIASNETRVLYLATRRQKTTAE